MTASRHMSRLHLAPAVRSRAPADFQSLLCGLRTLLCVHKIFFHIPERKRDVQRIPLRKAEMGNSLVYCRGLSGMVSGFGLAQGLHATPCKFQIPFYST